MSYQDFTKHMADHTTNAVITWLQNVEEPNGVSCIGECEHFDTDTVIPAIATENAADFEKEHEQWNAEPMKLLLRNGDLKPLHALTTIEALTECDASWSATTDEVKVSSLPHIRTQISAIARKGGIGLYIPQHKRAERFAIEHSSCKDN